MLIYYFIIILLRTIELLFLNIILLVYFLCTTPSRPSRIITRKPVHVTTKAINNNNYHTHAKIPGLNR